MLYVIHRGTNPGLVFRGGQRPIIHLEADLNRTISWAEEHQRLWAFSLSNAGAHDTRFRSLIDHLDQVNWVAVAAIDFRADDIKRGKQAEFLIHHSFPWELVERIGVKSAEIARKVTDEMHDVRHKPQVEVLPNWYF